jgi:hypothetical protein
MEAQQLPDEKIVYIHAGTNVQFADYQRINSDYTCVMIIGSETLRARTPGQIVRIGTYKDKWNHQDIEEGIARAEQLWGVTVDLPPEKEGDDKDIYDYGV